MEKLGQLRRADEYLIVVDTPPSRSALDFLDAPQRLSRFLDGRLIRLLTAPTRVSSRAYLKVVNARRDGHRSGHQGARHQLLRTCRRSWPR